MSALDDRLTVEDHPAMNQGSGLWEGAVQHGGEDFARVAAGDSAENGWQCIGMVRKIPHG
jgi:hypothetical protein